MKIFGLQIISDRHYQETATRSNRLQRILDTVEQYDSMCRKQDRNPTGWDYITIVDRVLGIGRGKCDV